MVGEGLVPFRGSVRSRGGGWFLLGTLGKVGEGLFGGVRV